MNLSDHNNNIETWFLERKANEFPDGINYVAKYETIKEKLAPVHKQVTTGADTTDNTSLTWHDASHIDKVIKQASKLLTYSQTNITAFETFVLLVSIQIHDIKNIQGRDEHENRATEIFYDLGISGIIDSILLKNIGFIVSCHSGYVISNDKKQKDKINLLNPHLYRDEKIIHLRFLAALLRLADEYADDTERAMVYLLEHNLISKGSVIHQKHAQCLGNVGITADTGKVYFDYHLTVDDALKTFPKYMKETESYEEKYLLDEIFERTVKSHYETVYCMRYLRPYITINKISVTIEIENLKIDEQLSINYELEEMGYPTDNLTIMELAKKDLKCEGGYWTGELLKEHLSKNLINV